MNEARLNIGLYVCHLENEYSAAVMHGADLAAKALDVNLFILPVRYIDAKYHDPLRSKYEYQYNNLISYGSPEGLDAVIFEAGTIGCFISKEKLADLMKQFARIPVVTLSEEVEGYPCIMNDCSALVEELEHLIKFHGRKRIAFIGGPETNDDSIKRFNVYKQVLSSNNIPYDEALYGAGDFTEYCHSVIEEVFDRCSGSVDAICFANDRMALAGYDVIKAKGLKIGEDISVVGFDDAPCATVMEPPLTTVRSDINALGYRAVEKCISLICGGNDIEPVVSTTAVIRSSCGCKSSQRLVMENVSSKAELPSEKELLEGIHKKLLDGFNESSLANGMVASIVSFFADMCKAFSENTIAPEELDNISRSFRLMIEGIDFDIISFDEFSNVLDLLHKYLKFREDDTKKQHYIDEIFILLYKQLTLTVNAGSFDTIRKLKQNIKYCSSIVDNVLVRINNDSESYRSIITSLRKLNFKNSFLYIHEIPIMHIKGQPWKNPKFERLVGYHKDDKISVLSDKDNIVDTAYIFRNQYLCEERETYVIVPIFFNEDNFGLLMCSMPQELYSYFSWVIQAQISYALKMKKMLEEQNLIQKHLQHNIEKIKSNNAMLRQISKNDELTGIYNRRGFIELAQEKLNNPMNSDKQAVMVFADMDNLKSVNDLFGHDDGDFALITSAMMLKKCFRSTDIIARVGGDEFAAFAFTNMPNFTDVFKQRLAEVIEVFNKNSQKPYYIEISAGVYEFTCSTDTSLPELMNKADELLYKQKKNKRTNIMKT